ncbi:endonuclease/exonuclease/phosphatase family protein [Maribacter flavus]|uniref:Endonuclease/exonuclease/phosphatase family protein n=1 Tax=Maribacter flavus TaxID=1658664 RepID=A0A5B2TMV2_9FLAO|nr:endonuclease/exonuclease/phosphatase family protein [Maribacter flavus]KAA2215544.1 endonuclease/exonuclease/phosphatase family protein [Maribacter flavus]
MTLWGKTVYGLNIVFSLALLLACVAQYMKSATLSFLSLPVPVLVISNFLFLLYWLMVKPKNIWLSFVVLLVGYFSLGSFVQFNTGEAYDDNALKVMSFNIQGFEGFPRNYDRPIVPEIAEFIQKENPDILCLQEFGYYGLRNEVFTKYPYSFTNYEVGSHEKGVLMAIYSKYPIINKGDIEFQNSLNGASFVDVVYQKDTLRVYNLHLESLKVRPRSLKRERSDRLLGRLRNSFAKQQEQSDLIRQHMNGVGHSKIVCADMNNTQYSYAYQELKQDMADTFVEKGNGYGRTINFWKFPLRIDFILTDPNIEVLGHKNYKVSLSDHEPIMAVLQVVSDK